MIHSVRRNAPALIALAALVLISGTTGAVAATVITGANIQDGSVTTADIANNNLTGYDIKDGSLGSADLSSATKAGLQRTTGITRVEVSQSLSPSGDYYGSAFLTASCGTKFAISGGYYMPTSDVNMAVHTNRPTPNGHGWEVYIRNGTAFTYTVTAYALCAN